MLHLRIRDNTVDAQRPFSLFRFVRDSFALIVVDVGICKATCHCGIVLLTQINCVRRIVQGRVCRYKIQRCEAPQRAVLLADPRRM